MTSYTQKRDAVLNYFNFFIFIYLIPVISEVTSFQICVQMKRVVSVCNKSFQNPNL